MSSRGNILIADQSALFFLMHCDAAGLIEEGYSREKPMRSCAMTPSELSRFNTGNPLYGQTPITILVPNKNRRFHNKEVDCHVCGYDFEHSSFFKLRENLYMATPQLVFARFGLLANEYSLIEAGINLCGRFWLSINGHDLDERTGFIANPGSLERYLRQSPTLKGAQKAMRALRFVKANSGSPKETQTFVQFCLPLAKGGFALPMTSLNYSAKAGMLLGLSAQDEYSIDLANPLLKVGLEYDGKDYHQDIWKDQRRRNELQSLGWRIYPLGKQVLYSSDETYRMGCQLRKAMGLNRAGHKVGSESTSC